jgi:hypothetical protein
MLTCWRQGGRIAVLHILIRLINRSFIHATKWYTCLLPTHFDADFTEPVLTSCALSEQVSRTNHVSRRTSGECFDCSSPALAWSICPSLPHWHTAPHATLIKLPIGAREHMLLQARFLFRSYSSNSTDWEATGNNQSRRTVYTLDYFEDPSILNTSCLQQKHLHSFLWVLSSRNSL